MTKNDVLLPVSRVAERLSCHRSHVYRLINDGHLKITRIAGRKGIRVYESSIFKYLETMEKSYA